MLTGQPGAGCTYKGAMNKALLFWLGFSCLSVACSETDPGSRETPSARVSSTTVSAPGLDTPDLVAMSPYVPDSGNMLLRCGRLIDGITDDVGRKDHLADAVFL